MSSALIPANFEEDHMDRNIPPPPNEASGIPRDRDREIDERDSELGTREGKFERTVPDDEAADRNLVDNPPRTTTGKITSPKFGSAGSGGAELEPGPKRP
jgi:hypothetical protein